MEGTYIINDEQSTQDNQQKKGQCLHQRAQIIDVLKIEIAQLICYLIPASCPFTRDILFLGYTLHIPPLCKLNPAYNFLMNLRWQSVRFLAAIKD